MAYSTHMTKEIFLQSGEVALVDDADHDFLNRFTWRFGGQKHKSYVVCSGDRYGKSQVTFFMHTLILGGKMGDHISGNTLDNQSSNLRHCTTQLNGWNKGKPKGCRHGVPTSRFKGVSYRPLKGKDRWLALIKYVKHGEHKSTGKMIYIGYFWNEIEAAKAYNKKVVELRGEFAWVNPIPEAQPTNKSVGSDPTAKLNPEGKQTGEL